MSDLIVGNELVLRKPSLPYAEDMFTLIDSNRNHLRPWLPWADAIQTVQDERQWIEAHLDLESEKREYPLMMVHQRRVVGVISAMNLGSPNRACEIGYWLSEDAQGSGIVTRSCCVLLDYVFHQCSINRVQIRAATHNLRSRAIPERLGFTLEGVQRQAGLVNGEYHNLAMYSMLTHEWKS